MTKQLMAINSFIFGGSATLGVEQAGFKVDRVLETADAVADYNAYHFVRNRPDIPIIGPSVWENPDLVYLREGMPKDVDFGFHNCNCSGLSLINRNASADNAVNDHFYRVAHILKEVNYKCWTLENAPALISIGMPVLKKFIGMLHHKYKFTVLRDFAANHNVPMKRQRTMIVGWNKEHFSAIPQIYMKKQKHITLRDVIGDITNIDRSNLPNHSKEDIINAGLEALIPYCIKYDKSIDAVAGLHYDEVEHLLDDRTKKAAKKFKERHTLKSGGIWDKSAGPTDWDFYAPSMTSMTRNIHPDGERFMTTREYARIMGYPDDFVFHEGSKAPHVQCMAQGVPVNFVKWIAEECKRNLEGDVRYLSDADVVFQHHSNEKYEEYSLEQFNKLDKLDITKSAKLLRDPVSEESTLSGFFA